MLFWTDSKAEVSQVGSSSLGAVGIWIVPTAGWVFLFSFKKNLPKSKNKNKWAFKHILWISLNHHHHHHHLQCHHHYCVLWGAARVISINSWGKREGERERKGRGEQEEERKRRREERLQFKKKNQQQDTCLLFLESAWPGRLFITFCPDLQPKQMSSFSPQGDLQWNVVMKTEHSSPARGLSCETSTSKRLFTTMIFKKAL